MLVFLPVYRRKSAFFRNFVQQPFGILPSEAGVGNGLAVNMVGTDILAPFHEVAFDHYALDQFFQFRIVVAAVEDFADNADLLFIFLAGIGVVYIYDHSGILQIPFGI